jgi:hypothetical protein
MRCSGHYQPLNEQALKAQVVIARTSSRAMDNMMISLIPQKLIIKCRHLASCGTAKQLSLSRITALMSTGFPPSLGLKALESGMGRLLKVETV